MSSRRSAGSIANVETLAYVAALLVNFVDQMGPQFTAPVLIPYGTTLGASLNTIALFTTARGIAAILSNVWMPKLSDWMNSRKWVACLSLVGCGVGYAVQGIAGNFVSTDVLSHSNLPSAIFMAGRFCTGFFSSMAPVLQAYITELSAPDMNLMTQRLVALQVASQVAGLALAPISGSLATFGLQLPFYVCAGIGVFAIVFVLIFFKEVSDIKGVPAVKTDLEQPLQSETPAEGGAQLSDEATQGVETQSASFANRNALAKSGSPMCDPVIILLFFSYMFVFVIVAGGSVFLMPIMFQDSKFGIEQGASAEEFQGNVAKVVGLCTIPSGVFQVIFAIFLYVPVTKRIGELPVIIFCALLAAVTLPLYGLWASQIWHVAVLQGIIGACFGFLIPALGPVCARYASVAYPTQIAVAQGVPMVGLQISVAFSQNVMAALVPEGENPNLMVPWSTCGACVAVFCVVFAIAHQMAEKYTRPKEEQNVDKKELEADVDANEFIDEMCGLLKVYLQDKGESLRNKHVRFIVQENLGRVIPHVSAWNQDTNGREHLEDTLELLGPYPEEQARFRSRYPWIGAPQQIGGRMLLQEPTVANLGRTPVETQKKALMKSPMGSPINRRAFSTRGRLQNSGMGT